MLFRSKSKNRDEKKKDNQDGGGFDEVSAEIGTCDVRTQTFTFVRSKQVLSRILQTAKNKNACVMYTIADPALRNHASTQCTKLQLPHVDLIGPTLNVLSEFLDEEPLGIPALFGGNRNRGGKRSRSGSNLGDSYYQRIDAVEFCLKADDGCT